MQPTGEWLNQPGGLAERLQRMRKTAGFTGDSLAAQLGWPRSKIPKLENGRQMPTAGDVRAWADTCGQPDIVGELLDMLDEAQSIHRQYRHQLRRGHAGIQDDIDHLVRQARHVRNFEVAIIPGLLQTVGYARYRMLEAVRVYGFEQDGVEAALAARMRRQEVLYDPGREFEFLITEAALRFRLCPPPVMIGQVDRLMSLSGLGNITIGIIPMDIELSVAPMHGFLIVDDVTYVETHTAEDILRGKETASYQRIADGLLSESAMGDDARRILASASERLKGL